MMTLQTVLRTIEHYKLLSANQTLIIGVSGGTDSLALFHMMIQLHMELAINLHVATLNHGIRGVDAQSDVQFVAHIAEQWRIPYTIGYADIPQLANDENMGIEEAARHARYNFLADVAQQQQSDCVAVAHHADDQLETILMHAIRGAGLKGLHGMDYSVPMPAHPHITLIRPLLNLSRQQLEQYCAENQLEPRHDQTNADITYQRNFIRHDIVPRLQQINPNVVASFLRLRDIVVIEDDFVSSQFDAVVLPLVERSDQRWSIPNEKFESLHNALQRRYIISAVANIRSSGDVLDANLVMAAVKWVSNTQVGGVMELGQHIRLRMGYEEFYVEDVYLPINYPDYRLIPENTNIELSIPSEFILNDIKITLSVDKPSLDDKSTTIELSQGLRVCVRTRHQGDIFRPLGMNGHSRTVKKWMIDRKIPRDIRYGIPIITIDGVIIAIGVGKVWHLADMPQYIVNSKRKMYLTLD